MPSLTPSLVVTKSALGVISVTTVALAALPLLLPGVGSSVSESLSAVLLILPVAGNGKVTVRVVLVPLGKLLTVPKMIRPVSGS